MHLPSPPQTLNPLKWLDGKRVVFGKVIDAAGMETLKTVEGLSCNNERPLPEVVISDIRVAAVPANPVSAE
jgi:cyclophilin family peptidyl-prolyl cis-trans isomerase